MSNPVFKRRKSYQIALGPTDDPLIVQCIVDNISRFYALNFYIAPIKFVPTKMLKNGEPWKDFLGRPIDEEFFLRLKTPEALNTSSSEMSILHLNDNGVRLTIDSGDRIEVAARWTGDGPVPKLYAVLQGFVEE